MQSTIAQTLDRALERYLLPPQATFLAGQVFAVTSLWRMYYKGSAHVPMVR
jgi:hypothetical protein